MKRIFLIATFVIFTILMSTTTAYTIVGCSCDYEDGRGGIACTNSYMKYEYGYRYPNSQGHYYYCVKEPRCSSCGVPVGDYEFVFETFEEHAFDYYGECYQCGYVQKSTSTLKPPSSSELQAQAYQMGDKMIGATAKCVYGGNIRQEPSEYAYRVGKIQVDDTYQILDYEVTSSYPTSVWLKINYGYSDAWVSASMMQITGASGSSGNGTGMIGRVVRINVSSGRARTNPGTNYPIIEYVDEGEVYTVLDCQTASNGTIWYKIKKDENFCWISSGIAD